MLPENTVVGRYQIARRVAQGGMGTLYLAQDPVLGRPVALKLFLGDLDLLDARERFAREARAAATLNHPHIVTIYDYGEYSSQPYMVMEFIQGETLAALIRRHADIALGTKLRWMEELCSAVEYAHGQGVIHRDLKPLNLMIDAGDRLKVLDFGIARMRGSLASHATARIGSAAYMAPEQIRGGNVDHRSDLFSIGVVCYELISYVEPFAADVDIAITQRILEDDPTPLQELVPAIDPELADLVSKALRKDPASRFQDAESMRKALAAVRRNLEASPTETVIRPRPALPVALPVAEATPRPSRETPEKRAERDALVRERTAQIQASLRLARQALEAGQLPAARIECDKVLRLDNAQPEALALARRIDGEMIRAEAGVLLTQGHDELQHGAITKAVELLERAREMAPDNPEAGRLDRAVRIARAQQDVERRRGDRFRQEIRAANEALGRGAYEDALGHAREALEIDPASAEALALEEEALRLIDEDTSQLAEKTVMLPPGRRRDPPTVSTEAKKSAAVAAPVWTRRWQDALALSRDRLTHLAGRWQLIPSRQRAMVLWGAATLAVLAVTGIIWASSRPWGPAPPPEQTESLVELQITPASSTVRVDGHEVAGKTLRLSQAQHRFVFSAPGYKTQELSETVKGDTFPLTRVLEPLPLVLQFSSNLIEAQAQLDAVRLEGSKEISPSDGADHTVVVTESARTRATITFRARAAAEADLSLLDEVRSQDATLIVVSAFGRRVTVRSPTPLPVTMNNQLLGQANADGLVVERPTEGELVLTVGTGDDGQVLTVPRADSPLLQVHLMVTGLGSIAVSANEDDSTVEMDGKPVGKITNGRLNLTSLTPARYTLRVTKDQYCTEPARVAVTLTRGGRQKARFDLKRPTIRVTEVPRGGTVRLNGVEVDHRSPIAARLGDNTLQMDGPGLPSVSKSVTIACGTGDTTLSMAPGLAKPQEPAQGPPTIPTATPGATATPMPAAVAEAPVRFTDVKIIEVNGKKGVDRDAILNFGGGQLVITAKGGNAPLATLPYRRFTHATFVRAKDPKWDPSLASPPAGFDTGSFVGGLFASAKPWLVLQGTDHFEILRLDDKNFRQILDAFETRTGIKINRQ